MANTAVKDVSSLFLNQAVPVAAKAAAGNGDFRKVWNSQMNKGASDSTTGDSNSQKPNKVGGQGRDSFQEKAPVQKDERTQPEDRQAVNASEASEAEGQEEAVSEGLDTAEAGSGAGQAPETEAAEVESAADGLQDTLKGLDGQEEAVPAVEESDAAEGEIGLTQGQLLAMEILGTAAAKLMEQIADAFGVTMEDLESAMDSLEMGQADLLDPSKLGKLLLKLGGAEDAYALITDGALYDNYRMIMGQLNQVLQEGAGELGTDPEQLPALLKDSMQAVQEMEAPVVQETEIPTVQEASTVQEVEAPIVQKTEVQAYLPADMPKDRTVSPKEDMVPVTEENVSLHSGTVTNTVQEGQAAPKQDTGAQQGNGKQPESKADQEGQLNFFTQDFKAAQFRPELQQVQEISQDSPWSADTKQIMDQILDYMKLSLNADTTSLEMQLHPASLGTLHVQIASRGGIVTANFITENEAVKAAVESQMLQLREQFEEQGVKVEAIEVTVQTHEFEQNLEQGRGRSPQDTEKKGRGRRIRLGGMPTVGDSQLGEAPEADIITAGGSTVSYTA